MNNQESGFWECRGDENNRHALQIMSSDETECRELGCQKTKPRQKPQKGQLTPQQNDVNNDLYSTNINNNNENNRPNYNGNKKIKTELKPQQDIKLLIALIILNIVSGFTTMYGAAQILPKYIGWSGGAAIQTLLLLLTSGSTLKHARWLKWMAVGSFSIISIYTSFFAYYDNLVKETREKEGLNRAISAHRALFNEVFNPIEKKAQQLENEIKTKEKQIKDEVDGRRRSGLVGCGKICKDLKDERENLQIRLNQVKPEVNKLEPLFNYDLEGKEPQQIFDADRKALAQVKAKCLPTEPDFICLPEKYNGSLDPLNPKYKELQLKYFDEDKRIRIIEPFLKIGKGQEEAIAALFIAILVDGCIILLGIGIEIPAKSKKIAKTITLKIEGTGTEFLDKLLETIDNKEEIDPALFKKNHTEYYKLLQSLYNETKWIEKNEEKKWVILDEEKFTSWVIKESEKLINNKHQNNSNIVTFYLPNL